MKIQIEQIGPMDLAFLSLENDITVELLHNQYVATTTNKNGLSSKTRIFNNEIRFDKKIIVKKYKRYC